MIEPSEMNINDVRPTLRRNPGVAPPADPFVSAAGFDTSDTTHLLAVRWTNPVMLRVVPVCAIR
jgi:hypothetical protein